MNNKNFDKIAQLINLDEGMDMQNKLIDALNKGVITHIQLINFACSKNQIKVLDFLLNDYETTLDEKKSLYNIAINNKINAYTDPVYFYSILKSIPNEFVNNYESLNKKIIFNISKRISLLKNKEWRYFYDNYKTYNFLPIALKYSIINKSYEYFNENIHYLKSKEEFNVFGDYLLNEKRYMKALFNFNSNNNFVLKSHIERSLILKNYIKIVDCINFFNEINYKLETENLCYILDDLDKKDIYNYIFNYKLSELKELIETVNNLINNKFKKYIPELEELYNFKEKEFLLNELSKELDKSVITKKRKI